MYYQDLLNTLEKAMQNGAVEYDAVRAFYNQAVASDRIVQARQVFNKLQTCFPADREIRSLNIALCLQEKNYLSAMENIETMVATCTPDNGLIDAGLVVRNKIGPIAIRHSAHASNTVSLCMIVKNEIAGIGACLQGAKPLVDEIIVVDTGSTDRTKDVAAIFGARTYDFTWCDDFAAARNFSLEQAQGKWILILDADEMIASSDHVAVKELIAKYTQNPTAFTIGTRNYTNAANTIGWHANEGQYPQHEAGLGWFPSRKVRLFPNRKKIRFFHPVHEQVEQSLRAHGFPIVDCSIPFHHYGNLNEQKKQKKDQIYFQLGYAKLYQLGDDFHAIRELASQAGQLELWNETIELWERLLKICPNYAEAYVNISSAYWQMAQYEKALDSAQQAMNLDSSLKEAKYNVAVSLLFLGRAIEAFGIFERIKSDHPNYLAAHFMLAATCGCIGDRHRSEKEFQIMQETEACQVVQMAIADFLIRLQKCGLSEYVHGIKMATKCLQTAAVWPIG